MKRIYNTTFSTCPYGHISNMQPCPQCLEAAQKSAPREWPTTPLEKIERDTLRALQQAMDVDQTDDFDAFNGIIEASNDLEDTPRDWQDMRGDLAH